VNSQMQIQQMTGGCGAEVLGLDLRDGLDPENWAAVRQAFEQYGALFFRDQKLSSTDHLQFARRWGSIVVNKFFVPVDGYPEIARVDKGEFEKANIGGDWHTDHSYDVVPAMGSILVAKELPSFGGDTMFASMTRAFSTLSEGLQRTLMGLKAVHSAEHVFGVKGSAAQARGAITHRNAEQANVEAVHPVVIKHPGSGEAVLYVNPIFTLRFQGWSAAESQPLLEYLYTHAARAEHTCRFNWKPGSVAIWDNRSTWHYAVNDYHGQKRVMHRITIDGCRLEAYRPEAQN